MKIPLFLAYCLFYRTPFNSSIWKRMLILVLLFFQAFPSQSSTPRETKVTLSVRSVPLRQVLKEIERQSQLYFFYNSSHVDTQRKVSLKASGSIDNILNELFDKSGVHWRIDGKQVWLWREYNKQTINPKNPPPILNTLTAVPGIEILEKEKVSPLAQFNKIVQGTVTDQAGTPLPGVNIVVKGTTNGTVSDISGKYQLNVPDDKSVLVFSYVGFTSQEVNVGTRTNIDLTLLPDNKALDELVVIGYGSSKKSDLTGSVGQVNIDDMVKAPVNSFAEALAGRVAGVQVSSDDGQPGGEVDILIRGAGSLTQSTTPLYVVDGFPIENLDPKTINPDDIKSISVLKDASSTAIYGSRAANGVIVIETKRGALGKPVVSFSTTHGLQFNPKKMELMSPYEFLKYQLEFNPTAPTTLAYFSGDKTLEDYRHVKGVDFQDLVFQKGAVSQYNLAIRGGTNQTKYSISAGLFDQKGVIINTGAKRYSGRFSLDQSLRSNLKVGVVANYSGSSTYGQVVNTAAGGGSAFTTHVLYRTWVYRPITSNQDVDLTVEAADDEAVTNFDYRINPYIDLKNQHQHNNTSVLDANSYLTYDIIEGLTFKMTGGIRHNRGLGERFFNSFTSQGSKSNVNNLNGVHGFVSNLMNMSFSNENSLNYRKSFGDHKINAFALFAYNGVNTHSNGYGGRQLPNENLGMDGIDQGVAFNPVSSKSQNRMLSYAGRLEYNYRSKYMATVTYRADGSSKFLQPWGYFPSFAVGWNMDKEKFFKEALPFISSSKLRASYGTTGNNRVGDYVSLPSLTQGISGYSYNNATPIGMTYVSGVGNSSLRWEKVATIDVGYEMGAFDNRLNLEIDWYQRTTTDLLLNAQLPPTTGFTTATKNIGELRNKGFEFTLSTVNVESKNFAWTSSFNISFNKNKIIALTRGQQSLTANGTFAPEFNKPLYISEIGKPAGMMIGFIWEGNYQYEDFDNPSPDVYILKSHVPSNGSVRSSVRPGDIKYKDLDGDLTITDNDLALIGRGQPLHIGGFSNNFRYHGLSLNVFFQWRYGNHIYNANRMALEGNAGGLSLQNQFASYANRWSPENPTNENYRTRGQGPAGFYSSRTVEDGSFLRLKTVALEYALPGDFTDRLHLKNLSVSVSSQNLYTWHNYSGLDPEVSTLSNKILSPGFDFSAYPQARTITVGLKASF